MQNSQQDLVRKTGMRAVRQACGKTFEEVEGFLKGESFPVVRKYCSLFTILLLLSIVLSNVMQ